MSDELKAIREHINKYGILSTSLGDVVVDKTLLGQGGNGLVFPVIFEGPAVIKLLADSTGDNPSTKYKRFQREYRRLVCIPHHPNLIRLFHYEVIRIGAFDIPAIIMERCAKSLKTYVSHLNSKRLPIEELYNLCYQMCSVLDHIHQNGIIHRDIKPENILVRDDGSFVLADFGIAKFDPELFSGTDLTKKGDRMANFAFSAPEQFEKDATITEAADVFALGQVLYWCATQNTFRGTSPPSMASVHESYAPFDNLVISMSRQQPSARIQTGCEVLATLRGDDEHRKEERFHQHVIECLRAFERALRRCTPGKRGIVHLSSKKEIDRLLSTLADICEPNELYWTKGYAKNAISQFKQLNEEHWLIDTTEYKITDCWITRDWGIDRCYVLMRSDPMPSFGLYGEHDSQDEVAGEFGGRYLDYRQVDDGFANIDGDIVELAGRSTVRYRYLRPEYFFVATKYNSVLVQQSDQVIDPLIKRYIASEVVDVEELEGLRTLPKNRISAMFD